MLQPFSSFLDVSRSFADECGTNAGRLDCWRAGEITSYAWTLEVSEPVLGQRRVRVHVQDGEPVSAVAKGEPVPIEGGEANGIPATGDALVELLIDSAKDARSVQIQWNEEAGYSSLIDLDLSPAIDDEITYRAIWFEALG